MLWDFFQEFRRKPVCLSDLLPWYEVMDKGIVRCKDEALLGVWRVKPLDISRLTVLEQGMLATRQNDAWKFVPDGWCIWEDETHQPARLEMPSWLVHPLAARVAEDHHRRYASSLFE